MLPRLLHDRLDEIGIDVAYLYPTLGLTVMAVDDDELRRAIALLDNRYYAEAYSPYRDRLLPVGVIPTYDPDEAIAELDHATGLGLRGFLFGGLLVMQSAPGHDGDPAARWVDGLGLDSAYDYDPLGDAVSSSVSHPRSTRRASASEAACHPTTTWPTTSATSRPAAKRFAARCSSVV